MKQWFAVAALTCGLGIFAAATFAADAEKAGKSEKAAGKTFNGILIDNACGDKQKDATAAAKHSKACAAKESCAKSGYQVVVDTKHLKFDDKGNTLAKEYLADADHTTKVVVMGTPSDDGKTIKVTSIKPAKEEKKEGDKADKSEKPAKEEK